MKLSEHPFLTSISDDNRRNEIIDEVELIDLNAGEVIFEENSESDALYLILSGTVTFTKNRSNGSSQPISESGIGSFFGEVGVFTGEPRALSAFAKESARVGRISQSTVKKITEEAEPVRLILESVVHHLKGTTDHYMNEVMRTEKLTLVGTMISSILHDFRNPFSIISLAAMLIEQQHASDPPVVKLCQNIEKQIQRMVNMANDLTDFSRGDHQIHTTLVSLDELFSHFEELNAPFFTNKAITLEMNANGTSLEGDANKLLRVLQNLIHNAIEAIRTSKSEGIVKVIASDLGDTIMLSFRDNGPGIPEPIRATLFDAFVTHGKKGGTGLGTAIVKSIVDAHNGDIDFQTGSEGTTFTISLPKRHQAPEN